jgi:carboxypeptidase family protein/TonB-dependent receptor-like protein
MRRRIIVAVMGLSLGLAGRALAQSQATTGMIEGKVSDESGAPIPGARVVAQNTATNYELSTVTDQNGRFRAPLLPLGPYKVTVTLGGGSFATLVRDGVKLSLGQSVNLDLVLKPKSVQEEITVTAEAPVVETVRTEGSTRIDTQAVEGLPNNGRNFLDYTKLTPSVSVVQGPDGDELSINGQKGIQNNISVDGADFNNPFFGEQRGGQRPPFTFNLDSVQEVVVVTDGANAEFGRSSSGFVNVITKSGTNDLHGSAHVFAKDAGFSANPKLPIGGEEKNFEFSQQQAGFTLGGPIKKDEAFYFLSLDAQRGRSTKQTDPNRIEQRVVDAFASLGSPNENGPIERTNDAWVALAKFDWRVSDTNNLTLRYNHTWSEQKNGTFDVNSWGRSANAIEKDFSNAVTGSLISNLSSTVFNEFRFQFAREDRPRPYNGPNVTGQNRPLPDTAFDFAKSYRFGEPFFIPVEYHDTRIQFNDNLTILSGAHTIKAGVEFNRVNSNQTFIGFANGRYIFDSTDGFLHYLNNPQFVECSDGTSSESGSCPAGADIVGPVLLYLQQAGVGGLSVEEAGTQDIPQVEPGVFLQDEWQPLSNVTIDIGLRWEAEVEPDPITPPNEVFFAPFIGKTVTNSTGTYTFPSDGTIPSDWKMFQPRLGISWDPTKDGKTAVRASAGIFAARVPGLVLASSRSTNGSRGQTLFRDSALTGILGPVPAYPNLIPQSEIGSPFDPDVFVFDKDFQNPRTYALSLSTEREIVPKLSGLVKFNYAATRHLTRFVNRNDPVFGSPWGTGLAPAGANGINTLTVVESSAKSNYWGVTLGLTKQWSDKYQFQVNYTLSKDKSDDDNERDPFSFRYARADRLDAEYGYSDRDQRHRLNGFFVATLPGDIDLDLRYSYRSAQPKSIKADGTDAATPQDRINPDGTITTRNLGRKDNQYSSLDLQISRVFKVGEMSLEPILGVFNLFNSDNFRKPEVTSLVFNFDGTVQSGAGDPLQVQAGVRVRW